MSQVIRTIRGAIYVVTPKAEGSISLPDGTTIATFATGRQTPFVAPGTTVIVSDDHAAVDIYKNASSAIALGGTNNAELQKHRSDSSAHLSAAERRCLATHVPHFAEAAEAAEGADETADETAAAFVTTAAAPATTCVTADTPLTETMNTHHTTSSWLAGLLTGWGIRESWAKIIAGALAGALAATGFFSACTQSPRLSADPPPPSFHHTLC